MYGTQSWDCAKNSNLEIIQRLQNKAMRTIAAASWYSSGGTLNRGLKIQYIIKQVQELARTHNKIETYPHELTKNLT